MAVGQFFNPDEGKMEFSPQLLLLSTLSQQDIISKEDHPLALDLLFAISLGLLPVNMSLKTTGCGIKKSGLSVEDAEDMENSGLCKLRCFPPVALAWDTMSGLRIFPNFYSETIMVDSSPAFWSSPKGSEKTNVLLLVDPHCSYRISIAVSVTAAACRFLLLHFSQIIGLAFAVVIFALMRQANASELNQPIPSLLSAVESILRLPLPFLLLCIPPVLIALFYSLIVSQPSPPVVNFFVISIICYLFASGSILVLILISQLLLYAAASLHVLIRTWWQWEGSFCFLFVQWILKLSTNFFPLKVVRIVRLNSLLVTALVAIALVCFVHPTLGLIVLLLSHTLGCHDALSSSLAASFRNHARGKELFDFGNRGNSGSEQLIFTYDGRTDKGLPVDENSSNSPDSSRSYGDTQLEIFHHRHGLLILHLFATLMFIPSLLAWLQRIGMGQSFPWFLDSVLVIGVILHGVCDSKPEFNFWFPLPGWEVRQSLAYLLAGLSCYMSGLALAPYRAVYAMAAIGIISFAYRIIERRNRERGEAYRSYRKHSHKHKH